jgi:predicted phosphodiesterase
MELKQITSNSHRLKFSTTSGKKNVKIAILSDIHFDNPDCDRVLLKKHLDYCLAKNISVLLNGDTFCLMQGKYDPRSSKGKVRPEHNGPNYLDRVVETSAEWFKPYAEIITVVGYGNHETSILRRQETDVIQRFVALLNHIAKPKIPIFAGGYTGSLVINSEIGGGSTSYNILYFHGSGGGGIVTRGEINLTRMATMFEGFDCLTIGHIHEQKETSLRKVCLDKNGKMSHRDVLGVFTGTYKDEYKEGKMGWHVERGAPNKPIGGKIVEINFKRVKNKGIQKYARSYNFPML